MITCFAVVSVRMHIVATLQTYFEQNLPVWEQRSEEVLPLVYRDLIMSPWLLADTV